MLSRKASGEAGDTGGSDRWLEPRLLDRDNKDTGRIKGLGGTGATDPSASTPGPGPGPGVRSTSSSQLLDDADDDRIVAIDADEDDDGYGHTNSNNGGGSMSLAHLKASMPYGDILRHYELERNKRNPTDLDELRKVAEEYQSLMEHVYIANSQSLQMRQKGLIRERYAATDRLVEIRKELGHEDLGQLDDESIEESLAIAETMPFFATQAIAGFTDHLLFVDEEVKWLEHDPDSEAWREMQDRYSDTVNHHEEIRASTELAQSYFKAKELKLVMLDGIMTEEANDKAVRAIGREILDSAMAALIEEYVVKEILQTVSMIKSELEVVVLKAVSALLKPNKGLAAIISGQSRIFIGAMNNMCALSYHKNAVRDAGTHYIKSYTMDSSQIIFKSGFVFRPNATLLKPQNQQNAELATWYPNFELLGKLSVLQRERLGVDQPRREPLLQFEATHWAGVIISTTDNSNKPNASSFIDTGASFGIITALQLFTDPPVMPNASILAAGSHKGTVGLWAIPWRSSVMVAGSKKKQEQQQVSVNIGLSPPLARNEVAKVVEIKTALSMSSEQIMALYENGHVRIWSLPPAAAGTKAKKTFLEYLFSSSSSASVPPPLACKYHFSPQSMNLPDQMQHSTWSEFITSLRLPGDRKAVTSKAAVENAIVQQARNLAAPQPNMAPTVVCFHPSTNQAGQHCAMMVGSEGGDIIKINYDFVVRELQSPVTYLPPFVGMEYVIPGTVHEDVVIAAANKTALGNKVFRELFHFHKSKVLFVGVVSGRSDTIVSVDSSNLLAMWKYTREQFEGNCWFSPLYSTQLDFRIKLYQPKASSELSSYDELEQDQMILQNLVLRKRYRTVAGKVCEVFYPCIYQKNYVEFRCKYVESVYRDITFRVSAEQAAAVAAAAENGTENTADLMDEAKVIRELLFADVKTVWSKQPVSEIAIDTKILKLQMSHDGTELFFLLLFTAPVGYTLEPDEQLPKGDPRSPQTNNGKGAQPKGVFVSIATYSLVDKCFGPAGVSPSLQVSPKDEIMSFSVGPVISETLTRHAFLHINNTVRAVSLSTGREVLSKASFPFTLPAPKAAGQPAVLSSVCSSQRVSCFAGPGDTKISVHRIQHTLDGKPRSASAGIITSEITQGYFTPVDTLQLLSVRSILPPDGSDGSLPENVGTAEASLPREVLLKQMVFYILDDVVLPEVYQRLDALAEKRARLRRLEEVYGRTEDLGVVKPNEWTFDDMPALNVPESEEMVMALKGTSSVDGVSLPVDEGDQEQSEQPGAVDGEVASTVRIGENTTLISDGWEASIRAVGEKASTISGEAFANNDVLYEGNSQPKPPAAMQKSPSTKFPRQSQVN